MQSMMLLVVPTQRGQSPVLISPAIQVVLGVPDQEDVPGGFGLAVVQARGELFFPGFFIFLFEVDKSQWFTSKQTHFYKGETKRQGIFTDM